MLFITSRAERMDKFDYSTKTEGLQGAKQLVLTNRVYVVVLFLILTVSAYLIYTWRSNEKDAAAHASSNSHDLSGINEQVLPSTGSNSDSEHIVHVQQIQYNANGEKLPDISTVDGNKQEVRPSDDVIFPPIEGPKTVSNGAMYVGKSYTLSQFETDSINDQIPKPDLIPATNPLPMVNQQTLIDTSVRNKIKLKVIPSQQNEIGLNQAKVNPENKTEIDKNINSTKVRHNDTLREVVIGELNYLASYRNPCLWYNVSFMSNKQREDWLCLPYFFLTGMPYSGGSDVSTRLSKHPSIIAASRNVTSSWWSNHNSVTQSRLLEYTDMFTHAADEIETDATYEEKYGIEVHDTVTFEANTLLFWHGSLSFRKSSDGLTTFFKFTTPKNVHQLLPNAKFIVLFRNPIERLFTEFLQLSSNSSNDTTAAAFHRFVQESISNFDDCLNRQFPLTYCVHQNLTKTNEAHLSTGLYSVFINEWLKYFDSTQFLFIRFEDYVQDRSKYLEMMVTFLGLKDYKLKEMSQLDVTDDVAGSTDTMLEITYQILDSFYQPYNLKLQEILEIKQR